MKNQTKKEITNFNKEINEYYNHSITIADAKSVAVLGANFILIGGLLDIKIDEQDILKITCISLSIISIFFSSFVIYPRLNKSKKGFIFWENVKQFETFDNYLNEIKKLEYSKIEEEYCKQNWIISEILSKKNKKIRLSIIFFLSSLLLSFTFKVWLSFL